jgi:hypothetical protein
MPDVFAEWDRTDFNEILRFFKFFALVLFVFKRLVQIQVYGFLLASFILLVADFSSSSLIAFHLFVSGQRVMCSVGILN